MPQVIVSDASLSLTDDHSCLIKICVQHIFFSVVFFPFVDFFLRDIVLKLLQYEASTNVADNKGYFPIHLAAWKGDVEIVKILIHHGPSHSRVNEQVHPPDACSCRNLLSSFAKGQATLRKLIAFIFTLPKIILLLNFLKEKFAQFFGLGYDVQALWAWVSSSGTKAFCRKIFC